MPVEEAFDALRLKMRLPSKVLVACPGLPRDSFYYYAIDGHFEGEFNRLYLVVDRADQVVAVELVDEAPHQRALLRAGVDDGWHTYDFINTRTKAITTLKITQKLEQHTSDLIRVDSTLIDIEKQGYSTVNVVKQMTRWYVPQPIVELVLTCVQKSGK
jgi:hypothetical protein